MGADWLPFVEWLINNAYQIAGVSSLSASGNKPAGLNSGAAIRSYDDIQEDRFSALRRRYQEIYPDLAYLTIEAAEDIVKATGKPYKTVFPDKAGIREIDFKSILQLKDNYVIQCFEESFLPKEPAGRQAKLSEMLAAGEITNQEFRRLSNFPDLEQSDQLAAALEERILKCLDDIIDHGLKGYKPPDPFMMDPSDLATQLCVQYINKYSVTDIDPEKLTLLRYFFVQIQDEKAKAQPPVQQQGQLSPLPAQQPALTIAPTSGVAV
jgi:hypothetical protein